VSRAERVVVGSRALPKVHGVCLKGKRYTVCAQANIWRFPFVDLSSVLQDSDSRQTFRTQAPAHILHAPDNVDLSRDDAFCRSNLAPRLPGYRPATMEASHVKRKASTTLSGLSHEAQPAVTQGCLPRGSAPTSAAVGCAAAGRDEHAGA
jgi:hypothetical protein